MYLNSNIERFCHLRLAEFYLCELCLSVLWEATSYLEVQDHCWFFECTHAGDLLLARTPVKLNLPYVEGTGDIKFEEAAVVNSVRQVTSAGR